MTDYDYDEPEAAALDLITDNGGDRVVYGMVEAKWSEDGGGEIVFIDMDSGHPVGRMENKPGREMLDEVRNHLVKYDEEIREEL